MKANIKNAMEGKLKVQETAKEKLEALEALKNELINDPMVQEYLATEKQIEEIFTIRQRKIAEYNETLQANCSHPLWVTIPDNSPNWDKTHSRPCECVVCGISDEACKDSYQELYSKKRLIADPKREYDSYEGRSWWHYLPIANKEEVREFYLKAYEFYNTIDTNIVPTEQIPTPEAMTFDHFVNRQKEKGKQKSIGAKTPTK